MIEAEKRHLEQWIEKAEHDLIASQDFATIDLKNLEEVRMQEGREVKWTAYRYRLIDGGDDGSVDMGVIEFQRGVRVGSHSFSGYFLS